MRFVIYSVLLVFGTSMLAVNVKDFGAKGDGTNDDTVAIQKAINAVVKQETFILAGAVKGLWPGHGGHGSYGEVFFPKGTYKINNALIIPNRKMMFRGEKGTTIKQDNAQKDVFYWKTAFRVNFENITVDGGKIQLHLNTQNNDMTMLIIRNCIFKNASDISIKCKYSPNSTLLIVKDCLFLHNHQVLDVNCDFTLLKDSKIDSGENAAQSIFKVANNCFFNNVEAYNHVPKDGQIWIEHDSGCFCGENLKFDVAGKKGIAAIRTSTRPKYVASAVRLLNSRIKAAGNKYGGMVIIKAGCFPNILNVSGNTEISGSPVRAAVWEKLPTDQELQEKIRYYGYKSAPIRTQFKITIGNNAASVKSIIPSSLLKFRQPGISSEIYKVAEVRPIDKLPSFADNNDFKVKIPDTRDATQALKEAFKKASKKIPCRVILPATYMYVTDTIEIPAGITVTAEGMCLISSKNNDRPVLQVNSAGNINFRNITVAGGTYGVEIKSGTGFYNFENCGFFNQKSYAVYAVSDNKIKNSAKVRIFSSIFFTGGGLAANASQSEITANWICNAPYMDRIGFFRNDGKMLVDSNLFVPILPRTSIYDGRKAVWEKKSFSGGNQVRWLDNYGKVHLKNNRLGGEFMGMTTVYNFSSESRIFIEGGYVWFGNFYTRPCIIFCDKIPEKIVLYDLITGAEFAKHNLPYNIWYKNAKGEDVKRNTNLPVIYSGLLYSK